MILLANKNTTWTKPLNLEWIREVKKQGLEIIDIGPDFSRRLENKIKSNNGQPSEFYGLERKELKSYKNIIKAYKRNGKFNKYPSGVYGKYRG